ncbi:MAG: SIS domain-containing protein [Paracoccaceae bacterium]
MRDHQIALDELDAVLDRVDEQGFIQACARIAEAGKIVLYGCGREGLQMRGLAMRLYHIGLNATMVAEMATPPLGPGDLFVVSSGPGALSTVAALIGVASDAGADILYLTANPDTPEGALATQVLTIPAQTMASDQGPDLRSVLPMGSIYEGALFVLFEMIVLRLKTDLAINPETMRARHTNME